MKEVCQPTCYHWSSSGTISFLPATKAVCFCNSVARALFLLSSPRSSVRVGRASVPLYLVKHSDTDGLVMTQLTKLQSYQVLYLLYVGSSVALSLVSLELPIQRSRGLWRLPSKLRGRTFKIRQNSDQRFVVFLDFMTPIDNKSQHLYFQILFYSS